MDFTITVPTVGHCNECGATCGYCNRRARTVAKYLDNPFEFFWPNVDKRGPDECWPWTGYSLPRGYGSCFYMGKRVVATHVALLTVGVTLGDGQVVRHTCDNPPCVNPAHLLPGTLQDNVRDATERNRFASGDTHWMKRDPERLNVAKGKFRPVLGKEKASEIKARLASGESPTALAREYGVRKNAIQSIGTGRSYRNVAPIGPVPMRGPQRKVSDDDVLAIREARSNGVSRQALAEQYGVSHRTILLIDHRKLHADV